MSPARKCDSEEIFPGVDIIIFIYILAGRLTAARRGIGHSVGLVCHAHTPVTFLFHVFINAVVIMLCAAKPISEFEVINS